MEEYVVIIEVPKLNIPHPLSLRISDHKNSFYLYSHKFLNYLCFYNEEINRILKYNNYKLWESLGSENFTTKKQNTYTYAVSRIELNLRLDSEKIFKVVREHFIPLLSIFSLFLTEIFEINVAYIFQRRNNLYFFIQMIEIPKFNKELSDESEINSFLNKDEIENHISWILVKLCRKKKYLEFLDEFLTGKIKSYHLGIELLNYWNTLEHISNRYWEDKGKNKILDSIVIRKLNKIITEHIEKIDNEDVIFPNLNKQKILEKNLILCSNRPPIRDKIIEMCKKIHIKLNEEDKNIIKMIYHLRNKLDHSEYYLSNLFQEFLDKFRLQNFKLKDLAYIVRKFSLLVQKVLLKILKIIPNYYILKQESEYFYRLQPRKMNLPSHSRQQKEREEHLKNRFNISGLSERGAWLKDLRFDKKELLNRGKYLPLIKYLSKLKMLYRNHTYHNFFSGDIIGRDFRLFVEIKFKDDLNFIFKATASAGTFQLGRLNQEDILFQMNNIEKYNDYGLEFRPIFKRLSSSFSGDTPDLIKVEGFGFILRKNLKKLNQN